MKKLAAAATAALVMLLLLAAPASARPYYDKPTCAASDSTVSPGDTVTVSGKFWEEGSQIDIILRPGQILLGTATATGPQGKFSIVVTIPEDLRPGRYRIFCRGRDQRGDVKVKNTAITVLGETVTPPAGAAFTGATTNVPLWAGLAGVLALAGVAALFAARLRRRRAGPDLSP